MGPGARSTAFVGRSAGPVARSGRVTYQITAVRSTARGSPAQFVVNFGIGGGLTIASITRDAATSVKRAA